jgi:heptosyltransferase-3
MKQPSTTDTLDRLEKGSRVAIIRLRSLGDCVLSTPAIHLLKSARPDLEIAVVAEDRFAPVFQNNPDIGFVFSPTTGRLRAFKPKLTVNLHGGTRSARLTMLSGAEVKAGFDIFKPKWIYNTRIPTAQQILGISRRVHTAEHMAAAMFYLGVPIQEVPRARVFTEMRLSGALPYAIIHPVAATQEKTWTEFGEVAKHLEATGLEPIFIAGKEEDLTPFAKWRTISGAPLTEVASLMQNAKLFIGNDSGPAHIAAAFGIPQVVIFGPSDAESWAPWRTKSAVLKAEGPISGITVDQVIKAIDQVMQ